MKRFGSTLFCSGWPCATKELLAMRGHAGHNRLSKLLMPHAEEDSTPTECLA